MTTDQSLAGASPTAQDAISAVVAAEGNLDLAAERLFGYDPDNPNLQKARLTSLLADDAASSDLSRILRTLTLLQAFSTLRLAALTVEATLEKLDANIRVRLYKNLLDSLTALTDPHTQTLTATSTNTSLNVSLSEAVIRALPSDVRDALKVLSVPEAYQAPEASEEATTHTQVLNRNDWSIPNAANGTD